MVLRVTAVPNPAAGADWQTIVPGQYTYRIVGITAQLSTAILPSTVADSSGNALTLTVINQGTRLTWGAAGPYAGGTNNYGLGGSQAAGPGLPQLFHTDDALMGVNPFTVDALVNLATGTDISFSTIFVRATGGTNEVDLFFNNNNANPADLRGDQGGSSFTLAAGLLPRGVWHHVAGTADGANWRVYLDGVLKATVAGHQPPNGTTPRFWVAAPNTAFRGTIAAVAAYPAALSAAQLLNHVGAMSTHDNYKAAVLADAPNGLWMLDELPTIQTRIVALQITDGSTLVGSYPAPFPVTAVPGPVTYSWQTNLASSAQTPNGATTTVAIPALVLPPGYTIGTRTLDLVGTDQWSNVNVWWDDGQRTGGGIEPSAYLNRLLTPDYQGRPH